MSYENKNSIRVIDEITTVGKLCQLLGAELPKNGEVDENTQLSDFIAAEHTATKQCAFFCIQQAWGFLSRATCIKVAREACQQGAVVLITQYPIEDADGAPLPCIVVDDVIEAIKKVGLYYRRQHPIKSIGVTGTCGKTTTKKLICCALGETLNVYTNNANANEVANVFHVTTKIPADAQMYVQEVSGAAPRRVQISTDILTPSACVITNIGNAHLDRHETIENLAKEKLSLATKLPEDGVAFLCKDDPILAAADVGRKTVYISEKDAAAHYYIKEIVQSMDGLKVTIVDNYTHRAGKEYTVAVDIVGKHNAFNIAAAFAVAQWAGVPEELIIRGLQNYRSEGFRQVLRNVGGYFLYLDCFSVSEAALITGCKTLAELQSSGRKIAVLGAKAHFGAGQDAMLRNVAKEIKDLPIDTFICYGQDTKELCKELWRNGVKNAFEINAMDSLVAYLASMTKPGDVVMMEAGMQDALVFATDVVYGTDLLLNSPFYRKNFSRKLRQGNMLYRIFECNGDALAALDHRSPKTQSNAIPASVEKIPITHINKNAYKGQDSLHDVRFGSNLVAVEQDAFRDCVNLQSVTLNKKLRYIGKGAFAGCSSLETIELPEGLIHIEEQAFEGCTALKKLYIPASVGVIGRNAFANCPQLVLEYQPGSYAEKYVKDMKENSNIPKRKSMRFWSMWKKFR